MFASLWLVPLCLAAVVVQVSAAPSSSPGDDVAKRGGHHQQPVLQQDADTSGHNGSSTSQRGGRQQQPVIQHDADTSGHNGSSTSKRGTGCPQGWTFSALTCSCYKFIYLRFSWLGAQARCKIYDANLVDITSAEENSFVAQLEKASNMWTGLNDRAVEGRWILHSSGMPAVYFNWLPVEPNNFKGSEDCTEMRRGGKWNDLTCSKPINFMCEKRNPRTC